MNIVYVIQDINKFSKNIAKQVAKYAGFSYKELKSYIKVGNVKQIIQNHSSFNQHGNMCINEEDAEAACEEIFDWLVGVDLAKLASNGDLDCYWDDEDNCMIFRGKGTMDLKTFTAQYKKDKKNNKDVDKD
tara:strand:- start:2418 stop:2810 length:393 start_codon:yes stop_codon:yes gene_type:complete